MNSGWVTVCPVLAPNVPFNKGSPERLTDETEGGREWKDDAIAAAEEEMSHTRARVKEELVAFALFIADI